MCPLPRPQRRGGSGTTTDGWIDSPYYSGKEGRRRRRRKMGRLEPHAFHATLTRHLTRLLDSRLLFSPDFPPPSPHPPANAHSSSSREPIRAPRLVAFQFVSRRFVALLKTAINPKKRRRDGIEREEEKEEETSPFIRLGFGEGASISLSHREGREPRITFHIASRLQGGREGGSGYRRKKKTGRI